MWSNYIFGNLDINYFIYFNLISSIGIILAIFALVFLFLYPKIFNKKYIFFLVILCLILYFQNRILYNMCINKKHILETLTTDTVNKIDVKNPETKDMKDPRINLSGGQVNAEIVDKIQHANNAWNAKYPDIKLNIGVIQRQLDKIDENTRPLQYTSNKNIVNN